MPLFFIQRVVRHSNPMTRGFAEPLLWSERGDAFYGPGHNGEIFTLNNGRSYLVYHCHWRNRKTARPDDYDPGVLETFANKHPERDYWVTFNCPEFTSLCPVTGQPDFAKIVIRYIPDERMVESKSLKLYLFSFRNHGRNLVHGFRNCFGELRFSFERKRAPTVGKFAVLFDVF